MNTLGHIDLDAWYAKRDSEHFNNKYLPSGEVEHVTDRNRINGLLSESDWYHKRELVKQLHEQGYIEVEAIY